MKSASAGKKLPSLALPSHYSPHSPQTRFMASKTRDVCILTDCCTSLPQTGQSLHKQIAWADAYIVTYSICDMESFSYAVHLLETISVLRGATRPPVLLLGNKKDLEHNREVRITVHCGL